MKIKNNCHFVIKYFSLKLNCVTAKLTFIFFYYTFNLALIELTYLFSGDICDFYFSSLVFFSILFCISDQIFLFHNSGKTITIGNSFEQFLTNRWVNFSQNIGAMSYYYDTFIAFS